MWCKSSLYLEVCYEGSQQASLPSKTKSGFFFATLAKFCHCGYFTLVVRQPFGAIPSSSDVFLRLMLFSVGACLVFVTSTERKIGLLPSMAIHISVTTCDACAADHVVRFTRPSPSVFAYCKRSKTGAGEGLGTRLELRTGST